MRRRDSDEPDADQLEQPDGRAGEAFEQLDRALGALADADRALTRDRVGVARSCCRTAVGHIEKAMRIVCEDANSESLAEIFACAPEVGLSDDDALFPPITDADAWPDGKPPMREERGPTRRPPNDDDLAAAPSVAS